MLPKKVYFVLGENKDLGNKLHSYYVYKCDRDAQTKIKSKIDDIIENYSDKKLLTLGYDEVTKKLLREFISLKKEPGWDKIMMKILKGLSDLLDREIKKAKKISKPASTISDIKKALNKLKIYHSSDIIKIEEKKGIVHVNYLSRKYSPEYNPKKMSYYGIFEPWRDTQLVFTLNFNKNLFIWDYINVHKPFHGRKIGTKAALLVEKFARTLGFTRFSVEYPNRAYWINKLNYKIPYNYRISSGRYNYTLEGYKEIK